MSAYMITTQKDRYYVRKKYHCNGRKKYQRVCDHFAVKDVMPSAGGRKMRPFILQPFGLVRSREVIVNASGNLHFRIFLIAESLLDYDPYVTHRYLVSTTERVSWWQSP